MKQFFHTITLCIIFACSIAAAKAQIVDVKNNTPCTLFMTQHGVSGCIPYFVPGASMIPLPPAMSSYTPLNQGPAWGWVSFYDAFENCSTTTTEAAHIDLDNAVNGFPGAFSGCAPAPIPSSMPNSFTIGTCNTCPYNTTVTATFYHATFGPNPSNPNDYIELN